MKELKHNECGSELKIIWVCADDDGFIEVQFECLDCGVVFSYTEGEE